MSITADVLPPDVRDIAAACTPEAKRAPMLRRATRGRRLPENLRSVVKVDRRTVIGREATRFRAALLSHCGEAPSETQKAMVDVAVQLKMHLLVMDARFAERAEMSAHDGRQYLAWANSLSRTLAQLGLKAAPAPRVSLAERMRRESSNGPPGPVTAPGKGTS